MPAASSQSLVHGSPSGVLSPVARRIIDAAMRHLFAEGYAALTMDLLAEELGMSKKTLYVHFSSKEALVGGVIDMLGAKITEQMKMVIDTPDRSFVEKLRGVIDVAAANMGRMQPSTLRQLRRYAPALYQKIDDIRQRNIPLVFGRIIREGIASGKVRSDVDVDFMVEFWLQAIRGMVQPEVLERTQLSLGQTLERSIGLFFSGILTPIGREEYGTCFPGSAAKPLTF